MQRFQFGSGSGSGEREAARTPVDDEGTANAGPAQGCGTSLLVSCLRTWLARGERVTRRAVRFRCVLTVEPTGLALGWKRFSVFEVVWTQRWFTELGTRRAAASLAPRAKLEMCTHGQRRCRLNRGCRGRERPGCRQLRGCLQTELRAEGSEQHLSVWALCPCAGRAVPRHLRPLPRGARSMHTESYPLRKAQQE